MFTLIRGADVYAPEALGINDILICGKKIVFIAPHIDFSWDGLKVIEASGKKAIPGLIDQHVHVTGGGGEGSFKSRVPELNLTDCIESGVTTLVGLLGTDGTTRSVENLVAKTKALNEEGITAYCLTGAYQFPTPTITGSIMKDITFIQECIGVKIAIADHRNSAVTTEELTRVAADARMAGLLSGKPGVVHLHTGRGKEGLGQLFDIIEKTNVPIRTFRPTHQTNSPDAIRFAEMGGYVDFSCRVNPSDTGKELAEAQGKIPWELLTLSSDSNGSLPRWDEKREHIIGMAVGRMTTLFAGIRALVEEHGVSLSKALQPVTETVAKALEIYPNKGALRAESDADIVLLDESLAIDTVIACGQLMMNQKNILVRGYFGQ